MERDYFRNKMQTLLDKSPTPPFHVTCAKPSSHIPAESSTVKTPFLQPESFAETPGPVSNHKGQTTLLAEGLQRSLGTGRGHTIAAPSQQTVKSSS